MRIFSVALILVLVVVLMYCCTGGAGKQAMAVKNVGSEKCQQCHKKEFDQYRSSDHFHAMDSVSPASVKGNFNNSIFVYFGDTSFFYQRAGKYFVKTKDSTGNKKEFLISYTFGWKPLQQYLVRFNDGRIQSLPFCWDTRPKEKGGQRWFHLYNKENILPSDELFWMGYNQNWNYMCADCHTTNFQKNFNVTENIFHSTWNESRVSCESCHGPASGHIAWTANKNGKELYKGFLINLATKNMQWKMDPAKGTRVPQQVMSSDTLIEVCSRCHARATRFTDAYQYGASFLQSHLPENVNADNYYVDGQIKGEDYEYGSFLQSKMHAKGITCINCHEPHSMQLKADGNKVCTSCHTPEKFDVAAHTHHKDNSTGTQCVNCHMPVTTYMVVDDRRDHSIRIPRPDLSAASGAPNACNKCHTDKSLNWAVQNFTAWYAQTLPKEKTYGELMNNISKFNTESESSLYTLLTSGQYPAIIKAAAIDRYTVFSSGRIIEQVLNLSGSSDPLLRLNALRAINNLPAERIIPLAAPLLSDPVKAIRNESVYVLAPFAAQLNTDTRAVFETALKEYIAVQESLSHRPEGFLNKGIILAQTGKQKEAERVYLQGINLYPKFIALYANLADLYRADNNESASKIYLGKALSIQPDNADLHYSLGLWFVRKKDIPSGMAELKKAASINPSGASIIYGYAVSLYSTGKTDEAIAVLEKYISVNGNNPQILDGLISICQDAQQPVKAAHYTQLRRSLFGN